MRKNQKVFKNDNDELEVEKYPKNKLPNCPTCKQNYWLEFDKGYYCKKLRMYYRKTETSDR